MLGIASRQPMCSTELGGSNLVGVRHLREEHQRRQLPRRAHQTPETTDYDVDARQSTRALRVSPRQIRRIEDTHAYLCAKVDPIMGPLILALVSDKPQNVREAALNHILSKKNKQIESGNIDSETFTRRTDSSEIGVQSEVDTNGSKDRGGGKASGTQREVGREDRVFMAREVGPLVSALINRALRFMPADVEEFLIEELQNGNFSTESNTGGASKHYSSLKTSTANDYNSHAHTPDNKGCNEYSNQGHQKHRPSSARSRLQQAKGLDRHVQQTAPLLSARAVERESHRLSRATGSVSFGEEPSLLGAESGGGGTKVGKIQESRDKPWDAEMSSTATVLPTEVPSPGACETRENKAPQVDVVVLLLGLDAAGKTTMLGTLQGEKDPRVCPTVGFKPVTMLLNDQLMKVKFYDLGGGKKIRRIWDKYYHDAHALIYVVDGADGARWEETKELFLAATSHKYLRGKPVAVIVNKEDAGVQIRPSIVAEELRLSAREDAQVWSCSINVVNAKGGVLDNRLEKAVGWLLENVKGRFAKLNERVQHDIIDMEREFQLEKERKQLDVMRGLLRNTFLEDEEAARGEHFDETQGLEFLASELGLEVEHLPADGANVAALVGYQKLALQMVGNMKSPISRRNQERTWNEIQELVVSLRREIGIDH